MLLVIPCTTVLPNVVFLFRLSPVSWLRFFPFPSATFHVACRASPTGFDGGFWRRSSVVPGEELPASVTRVQFCLWMIRQKIDNCDSSIPGNLKTGFPESQMDTQEEWINGLHVILE